MGHENFQSLLDRFFDWKCGWIGGVGLRARLDHVDRASSSRLLPLDSRYDHRDSDSLAAVDRNKVTVNSLFMSVDDF